MTAGVAFDNYLQDVRLRLATERCLEIVSEASRHIPMELKEHHPVIPWRQVAGIGNILRHGYRSIDDHVIWNVVLQHLPPLKVAVHRMLAELDARG